MNIALYYIILLGAVAGSVYYLCSGLKLLRQSKMGPDDQLHVKAVALWKTALGGFGTILWITISVVSIYNQVFGGK